MACHGMCISIKVLTLSIPAGLVGGTVMNKTGLGAACLPSTKIHITSGICFIAEQSIPPLAVSMHRAHAMILPPLSGSLSFGACY